MTDTEPAANDPAATPDDPAMAASDPAMFAPLTTTKTTSSTST